jgi:hypothetical protein
MARAACWTRLARRCLIFGRVAGRLAVSQVQAMPGICQAMACCPQPYWDFMQDVQGTGRKTPVNIDLNAMKIGNILGLVNVRALR